MPGSDLGIESGKLVGHAHGRAVVEPDHGTVTRGNGGDPDVIRITATEAERHGFATLWAGEHVVMVDHQESRYPYADNGKIAVPATADWLDPMITLSYAAAVTTRPPVTPTPPPSTRA